MTTRGKKPRFKAMGLRLTFTDGRIELTVPREHWSPKHEKILRRHGGRCLKELLALEKMLTPAPAPAPGGSQ